jgi:hypothetical protein
LIENGIKWPIFLGKRAQNKLEMRSENSEKLEAK